jgi:hypothetical protein
MPHCIGLEISEACLIKKGPQPRSFAEREGPSD